MLIGNVGRDPEVRYLDNQPSSPQGTKVASFTLATTERYRDRAGELRENTEWHNIVAWRNSADIAEKFIKKGTQIYVEGRLRTRSWTDQSGAKRYTTEIVVDNLQLLGRRSDNPGAQDGGYSAPAQGGGYAQPSYHQAPAQPSYQQAPPSYQQAPAQPSYRQPAPAPAAPSEPINIDLGDNPSDDLPF